MLPAIGGPQAQPLTTMEQLEAVVSQRKTKETIRNKSTSRATLVVCLRSVANAGSKMTMIDNCGDEPASQRLGVLSKPSSSVDL